MHVNEGVQLGRLAFWLLQAEAVIQTDIGEIYRPDMFNYPSMFQKLDNLSKYLLIERALGKRSLSCDFLT